MTKKNVFPQGNKHVLCGKCCVACCLGKTGLVRLSRFLRKWDCFQALLAQTLCLETRQMHASEVFLVCTVYRTPTFHLFWNKLLFFDLCHKMNCRDLELFHSLNHSGILVKKQLPERKLSFRLKKTDGACWSRLPSTGRLRPGFSKERMFIWGLAKISCFFSLPSEVVPFSLKQSLIFSDVVSLFHVPESQACEQWLDQIE